MNTEYTELYQTLELAPGAAAEEVKSAYFRLLRRFSPEKDPEQFKRIRQAYEALKDGPPETEQSFQPPEDPFAQELLEEARLCMQREELETASKFLEEALKIVPDDPYLLLRLAQTQQEAEHPQKAAKTAQRLAKLYPSCREAHTIMANGFYARGWKKKALSAFREAYRLGERGVEFLSAYVEAAVDTNCPEEGERVNRELLAHTKWNKQNIVHAYVAWCAQVIQFIHTQADALEFLDDYQDFLIRSKRFLGEPLASLSPLVVLYVHHEAFLPNMEIYHRADALVESFPRGGPDWDRIMDSFRCEILSRVIREESRLRCTAWPLLADVLSYKYEDDYKEQTQRYITLDAQLCLLKEEEDARQDISIIRNDYQYFYAQNRDFLDQLGAGDTGELFVKLKREFFRLVNKYEGSNFLERHPEEQPGPYRTVKVYDGPEPFVRAQKKVGRNDPCPCGSGKKFKRCCMGKGIYD